MRSIAIIFAIMIMACMLFGCAKQRQQDASDAIAGAEALAVVASTDAAPELVQGVIDPVLAGVRSHMAAAVATPQGDLPMPTKTAEQILTNPGEYQEHGQEREKDATTGIWAVIGGGVLLAVGLAMKAIKNGQNPLHSVIDWMFGNARDRKEKDREDALSRKARAIAEELLIQEDGGNDNATGELGRLTGHYRQYKSEQQP